MASIKNFKKDLVYTYGALLDQCYIAQMVCPSVDKNAIDALCDEIENTYEEMANRLGGVKGKKDAVKVVKADFEASLTSLSEKLEALVEKK